MSNSEPSPQDPSGAMAVVDEDKERGNEKMGSEKECSPEASQDQLAEDESKYPHGLHLGLILVSLCLSIFLVALDQTIIAPALGAITTQFNSIEDIGWYGAAYLLTTTAVQPLYGNIYSLFDIKMTFLGTSG